MKNRNISISEFIQENDLPTKFEWYVVVNNLFESYVVVVFVILTTTTFSGSD